jgi:hypothetical protein
MLFSQPLFPFKIGFLRAHSGCAQKASDGGDQKCAISDIHGIFLSKKKQHASNYQAYPANKSICHIIDLTGTEYGFFRRRHEGSGNTDPYARTEPGGDGKLRLIRFLSYCFYFETWRFVEVGRLQDKTCLVGILYAKEIFVRIWRRTPVHAIQIIRTHDKHRILMLHAYEITLFQLKHVLTPAGLFHGAM